ncbi:MAG TPA: hypothetical protein PLT28_00210 [Saprospiraceae bacterium]|nr:hypothetical protein [Saprospiraceae bacterium]
MARAVNADDVLTAINAYKQPWTGRRRKPFDREAARICVRNTPTLMALHVGHWIEQYTECYEHFAICSECGRAVEYYQRTNYCPDCGSYNKGGEKK